MDVMKPTARNNRFFEEFARSVCHFLPGGGTKMTKTQGVFLPIIVIACVHGKGVRPQGKRLHQKSILKSKTADVPPKSERVTE